MLKTYFFVPANNDRFLNKVEHIKADEIVLDLEDTVPVSELIETIDKISKVEKFSSYYVRPNLFPANRFDLNFVESLIQSGFRRFVLPKLESVEQFEQIINRSELLDLIILIEHPSLLIELAQLLAKYSKRLKGIGIGAHDFSMNANHMQYENFIDKLRVDTAIYAAAFHLECIDTASMIITDEQKFKNDCVDAFNSGCTGKFLIHPNQLKNLHKAKFFQQSEINWAKKALDILSKTNESDLSAISVDGKVLERPHLKRIKQIQEYLKL